MRARTEFLRCVIQAHECHEAARKARREGDHVAADFYAACAAIDRRHAAGFAATAKALKPTT
jgi:hypothetical protein